MKKIQDTSCPCGSPSYSACCQPFHTGQAVAPDAQTLMKSRYSAYALGLDGYVSRTWHPSTRPAELNLAAEQGQGRWIGLDVRQARLTGENKAEVEFVARYKPKVGAATRLHESSRFVREEGQWFYVDGDLYES